MTRTVKSAMGLLDFHKVRYKYGIYLMTHDHLIFLLLCLTTSGVTITRTAVILGLRVVGQFEEFFKILPQILDESPSV